MLSIWQVNAEFCAFKYCNVMPHEQLLSSHHRNPQINNIMCTQLNQKQGLLREETEFSEAARKSSTHEVNLTVDGNRIYEWWNYNTHSLIDRTLYLYSKQSSSQLQYVN